MFKKRWIILFLVLTTISISACAEQSLKNVSVCGDGKCDPTENCNCQDCASRPDCQGQVATNCDDQDQCTEDVFNTTLNTCQHKPIKNCCGNKICELNERDCNFQTYQTNCVSDCKLNCPAHILIQKSHSTENRNDEFSYVCADSNCKQTGENKFELTDISAIKTTLINNGELISGLISSNFYCYRRENTANKVTTDNSNLFGVVFRDYFDNDKTKDNIQINSRITGNNFATYTMEFNSLALQLNPSDVTCAITLSSGADNFNNAQVINLKFYK